MPSCSLRTDRNIETEVTKLTVGAKGSRLGRSGVIVLPRAGIGSPRGALAILQWW